MGRTDQLADFNRFDFDNDPRWKEYFGKLEFTGNPDAATVQRLRGKWYKREIDPNFDPSWLASNTGTGAYQRSSHTSNAGSTGPSGPAPTPEPAAGPRSTYTGSGRASGSPPTSTSWSGGSNSSASIGNARQQQQLFIYHVALLLLALVAAVPLLPRWSMLCYRSFMQLSILGQAYKIYLRHGLPSLRPFSWPAIQMYLMRVVPSSDFHYLILGASFMSHVPIVLALVPPSLAALQSVLQYGAQHFAGNAVWRRTGAKLHDRLRAKQDQVQLGSAMCELGVGGLLVLGLFSRARNVFLAFAYANLLKMRYHVSDAAAWHRQAWSVLDGKTAGIRAKVPVLRIAVDWLSRWFLAAR